MILSTDNIVVLTLAALLVLGALFVLVRRRRPPSPPRPSGVGAAIALVVDGAYSEAAALLEARMRATSGTERADAALGLVAVLRAGGDLPKARSLVEALVKRGPALWLDALRLRLALDGGQLRTAQRLLDAGLLVPAEVEIAALARSGRFEVAVKRYRSRLPRALRTQAGEATLLAGQALVEAGADSMRLAAKLARQAYSLCPDALMAQVASVLLDGRDASAKLASRLGGLDNLDAVLGIPLKHMSTDMCSPLVQARALAEEGEREHALGVLRDRLDVQPDDLEARLQYDQWILESGSPQDWRAELSEVLEILRKVKSPARYRCARCGLAVEGAAFFVCPRCDALDTLTVDPAGAGGRAPSMAGASIKDWVRVEHLAESRVDDGTAKKS